MLIWPDASREPNITEIAELHIRTLPTSIVSLMGLRFAKSFYNYCRTSRQECIVCVSGGGRLTGAAVVSLSPSTLSRRLAFCTPMLFHLILIAGKLPIKKMMKPASTDRRSLGVGRLPELIHLFVAESARGAKFGVELMSKVEEWLRDARATEYCVKTFADSEHASARFYMRNGFQQAGLISEHGESFLLLQKSIRPRNIAT